MLSDLSAASAWLGGALMRSFFAMLVAASLIIALSDRGPDLFELFCGTLWSGLLWFGLVESLVLLLLARKRRPSSRAYHRRSYYRHP